MADGRAHVDDAEVDGIVAAVERDLQLQVVLLVNVSVGNLTDQLGDVGLGMSLGVNLGLNVLFVLEVIGKLLQASGLVLAALLRQLDVALLDQVEGVLATLVLTQLRVVHGVGVQHDLLSAIGDIGTGNQQIVVRGRLQLK